MNRRDSGLVQNGGESSEAIVSRIYEEELSKLAQQAKQSGNIAEYQLYQVIGFNCISIFAQQLTVFFYAALSFAMLSLSQTELDRIVSKKSSRQPSPVSSSSAPPYSEPQVEPEDLSLANQKPLIDLRSDAPPSSRSDSPLQQMQNITNQFLSSSQAHLLQQKPLKHVLPPISQEQFDKYTGLNTEELVKKVCQCWSFFYINYHSVDSLVIYLLTMFYMLDIR